MTRSPWVAFCIVARGPLRVRAGQPVPRTNLGSRCGDWAEPLLTGRLDPRPDLFPRDTPQHFSLFCDVGVLVYPDHEVTVGVLSGHVPPTPTRRIGVGWNIRVVLDHQVLGFQSGVEREEPP